MKFFKTTGKGQYLKTQNGNYFVFVSIEDCENGLDPMFVTPEGKEIRTATLDEWYNAAEYWDCEKGDFDENYEFNFIEVINLDLQVEAERISEDYSKYKAETSNNGGDYGFWTNLNKVLFEGEYYEWETEHTTSEISFDELEGKFQDTNCYNVAIKKNGKIYNTGAYIRTQPHNIKGEYFFLSE